jgi:hypothetical protein
VPTRAIPTPSSAGPSCAPGGSADPLFPGQRALSRTGAGYKGGSLVRRCVCKALRSAALDAAPGVRRGRRLGGRAKSALLESGRKFRFDPPGANESGHAAFHYRSSPFLSRSTA